MTKPVSASRLQSLAASPRLHATPTPDPKLLALPENQRLFLAYCQILATAVRSIKDSSRPFMVGIPIMRPTADLATAILEKTIAEGQVTDLPILLSAIEISIGLVYMHDYIPPIPKNGAISSDIFSAIRDFFGMQTNALPLSETP